MSDCLLVGAEAAQVMVAARQRRAIALAILGPPALVAGWSLVRCHLNALTRLKARFVAYRLGTAADEQRLQRDKLLLGEIADELIADLHAKELGGVHANLTEDACFQIEDVIRRVAETTRRVCVLWSPTTAPGDRKVGLACIQGGACGGVIVRGVPSMSAWYMYSGCARCMAPSIITGHAITQLMLWHAVTKCT
jgi:hypothetical protein